MSRLCTEPQMAEWGGAAAQGCAQGLLPTLPVSSTVQGRPRNAPGSARTNRWAGAWGVGEGAPLAAAGSEDSTVAPTPRPDTAGQHTLATIGEQGRGGTQS